MSWSVTMIMDARGVSWVVQVASTSRGGSAPSSGRAGSSVGTARTPPVPTGVGHRHDNIPQEEGRCVTTDGCPQVLAVREGEPLPEGYTLVVRTPATPTTAPKPMDMVDLTTPPDAATETMMEDADTSKGKATEQRNLTKKGNRVANAAYFKDVKDSLAGGKLPTINVSEGETHLKTRWQAAAKEVAYRFLDLRKEGWKSYSIFEKNRVHKELDAKYRFDPPLDPDTVDKYLAQHLRSARAAWKSHWSQHGDDNRHPNCPEEAWEVLTKWWPTDACREEAARMAARRSKVKNRSKTGRKRLVDRLGEQVSQNRFAILLFCTCNCMSLSHNMGKV